MSTSEPQSRTWVRTARAIGPLLNEFPAFPRTSTRGDPTSPALTAQLQAHGIGPTTFRRFETGLGRLASANPADCRAALEKTSGFWSGSLGVTDTKVVFTERPIDALAYTEFRGERAALVVAVGREHTPESKAALQQAINRLPTEMTVVTAFSNDLKGTGLAESVAGMAAASGHRVARDSPPFRRTWCEANLVKQRDAIRALGLMPAVGVERGR